MYITPNCRYTWNVESRFSAENVKSTQKQILNQSEKQKSKTYALGLCSCY